MALAILLMLFVMPTAGQAQTLTDSIINTASDVIDNQPIKPNKRLGRRPVVLPEEKKDNKSKTDMPVRVVNMAGDTLLIASLDSIGDIEGLEILTPSDSATTAALGKQRELNLDPTRALWLSALCPGLGQIYNRRYWKLPIVIGAFVGLTYGTSWNNRMYNDYTKAYRDAMDDDPDTRSYMDFYPPTTQESDLDMEWLKKALKNKKNYYRRYRDICIISLVGMYALCIIDAYVDAQLAHFDISPDLSMKVKPAVIDPGTIYRKPTLGIQCAFNF